jgi:hypothetical protein
MIEASWVKLGRQSGKISWKTSNSEKKNKMKGYIVTGRMEMEWKGGRVVSNKGFWH